MNKLAAIAILAYAALAVSATTNEEHNGEAITQAGFLPTDLEEVESLKAKNLEVFNDFCISSRDHVVASMKSDNNDITSALYDMVFGFGGGANKAVDAVREKLLHPRATFGNGCDQVRKYKDELREQFEAYKRSSLGADASKYAELNMDDVPCVTTWRINQAERLCNFLRPKRN